VVCTLGSLRHPWRRRFAVFGIATLAFGALFFFTTDWHARAEGRVAKCFSGPPTPIAVDTVSVQRIPPGVRCEWAKGSYLVRPDATDWFVLLGESSAGGFAVTGPVLWLMGLARRRRLGGLGETASEPA
jgi:hypothetical protein